MVCLCWSTILLIDALLTKQVSKSYYGLNGLLNEVLPFLFHFPFASNLVADYLWVIVMSAVRS